MTTAFPLAATELPSDAIEVGRIGDAWGVKGWFKVLPHSAQPQALFAARRWYLQPSEKGARTFSGTVARRNGQEVLYITERCVFELTKEGLKLIEVAPGIDIEKDILAHMDFKPIIDNPKLMDARLFQDGPMGLKR